MTLPLTTRVITIWAMIRHRMLDTRHDQRGEVTSQVILIAIFAALAIAIGAIIVAKVTDRANSIPTS